MQQSARATIIGVVLAGGLSRRFGAAKAFAELQGTSLISHVIGRAAPQVATLLISAVGDDPRLAPFGATVVRDELRDGDGAPLGPLAGIHAALSWVSIHRPQARWLASFSVDTPLVPRDLVACLRRAAEQEDAEIACSRSDGRLHPLLAVWSPWLRDEVRLALERGERAVHRFVERRRIAVVDFPTEPYDPFSNVNTPADLARIAEHLGRQDMSS